VDARIPLSKKLCQLTPLTPHPDPTTAEISPEATAAWLAEAPAAFQLIDCREPDEWALCRIEGATLIPLSQFAERALPALSPDRPVVVYCHHGMRSLRATQWLRHKGVNAWSLAGGIDAWSEVIDEDVPRY
jgi:rhodanese-related sulfurtransferase